MSARLRFLLTICGILVVIYFISMINVVKKAAEESKQVQVITKIRRGDYGDAKELVQKYYKNNPTKATEFLTSINKKQNKIDCKEYVKKLQIPENWDWAREGNFTLVKAKVKNAGDRTVIYFKIEAKYLDKKNEVADKDTFSSTDPLPAGQTKDFEIKHKYSADYKIVKLYIDKVALPIEE